MLKKIFNPQFWMPLVILGLGAGLVTYFMANKPEARKRQGRFKGTLVEVTQAVRSNPRIVLETHGSVRAAQRVVVTAQVNGVVNWISPLLEEGSYFQTGELLMTLDPLNNANLDFTLIKAPFNGVVQERNVDLGQYVNTGTQLANLIGSDSAEVLTDVPMSRLQWLMDKPEKSDKVEDPNKFSLDAEVSMRVGSEHAIWNGRVERHLLELTPKGMMVQLILSVEDPFRLRPSEPGEWISLDNKEKKAFPAGKKTAERQAFKKKRVAFPVPLFIGAFVDVKIPGRILESVIELPVRALRDENTVWVVENGLLQIRKVEIVHFEGDYFYVSNGLMHGEEVVTSPLKGAADGMKVSFQESGAPGRSMKTQGRNGEQKQGTGRGMKKQKAGKQEWQKPTTSKVPAGSGEEAKRQRPRNQNKIEQEGS